MSYWMNITVSHRCQCPGGKLQRHQWNLSRDLYRKPYQQVTTVALSSSCHTWVVGLQTEILFAIEINLTQTIIPQKR